MASGDGPIDYTKIDELEGLSIENGDDFISDLITKFLLLMPARLESLINLSKQGKADSIKREIHSFKLSCQILGAKNLIIDLEKIARAAQDDDQVALQSAVSDATLAAQHVENELNRFLRARLIQR